MCGLKVEPAIEFEELIFDLGGGKRESSLVGHPDGNRIYRVTALLPNSYGQRVGVTVDPETLLEIYDTPLGGLTRARYVWELFKLFKRDRDDTGIIVKCPIEEIDVQVEFTESRLSYDRVDSAFLWNTGFTVQQVRDDSDLSFEQVTPTNPNRI